MPLLEPEGALGHELPAHEQDGGSNHRALETEGNGIVVLGRKVVARLRLDDVGEDC